MLDLPALDLPDADLDVAERGGKAVVFDPLRSRWVRLTPEEWVRQHVAQFLTAHRGYPASLLAVEQPFVYEGEDRRADLVAHDRTGRPVLLAECKAPEIAVNQAAFDQVAAYNRVLGARLLLVTNGLVHFVCRVDAERANVEFLDDVPAFLS